MWSVFNAVMRVVSSLIGLLMVLMGGVWILQGLNLAWGALSRSFMQGDQLWAFYGAIMLVAGVCQILWTNKRRASDRRRMGVLSSSLGLLMALMGAVWILQGLDLAWGALGRSFMQGDRHWAFYGAIMLIVGVCEVVWINMRQTRDS